MQWWGWRASWLLENIKKHGQSIFFPAHFFVDFWPNLLQKGSHRLVGLPSLAIIFSLVSLTFCFDVSFQSPKYVASWHPRVVLCPFSSSSSDRVLLSSPLTFDPSVVDLFGTLSRLFTLVPVSGFCMNLNWVGFFFFSVNKIVINCNPKRPVFGPPFCYVSFVLDRHYVSTSCISPFPLPVLFIFPFFYISFCTVFATPPVPLPCHFPLRLQYRRGSGFPTPHCRLPPWCCLLSPSKLPSLAAAVGGMVVCVLTEVKRDGEALFRWSLTTTAADHAQIVAIFLGGGNDFSFLPHQSSISPLFHPHRVGWYEYHLGCRWHIWTQLLPRLPFISPSPSVLNLLQMFPPREDDLGFLLSQLVLLAIFFFAAGPDSSPPGVVRKSRIDIHAQLCLSPHEVLKKWQVPIKDSE